MHPSHEEFISNINGSTKSEVLVQQLVMPATIFFYGSPVLQLLLGVNYKAKLGFWTTFLLENFLFAILYQLVVTLLADYVGLVVTICVASALVTRALFGKQPNHKVEAKVASEQSLFTTWTRGWLYLATAICILAVDFPAFPRRFAKCENFGVSLMDTGVGWYVVVHASSFNNAIARDEVSTTRTRLSRGDEKSKPKTTGTQQRSPTSGILNWLKHTLPLFLLGMVRLIAVKSVEYPEHVTEYGVHFNFFFTLFSLKILASLLRLAPGRCFSAVLFTVGCAMLVASEVIMQSAEGRAYLFDAPRVSLVSANREGLFSLLGYSATFCFASLFTRVLLVPYWKDARKADLRVKYYLFAKLLLVSTVFYAALCISETYLDPVSRRFANAAFVFWTLSLSTFVFSMFLLVETALGNCQPTWPSIFNVLSRFGLIHFLTANLLTGLVNLTFNAHDMSDARLSGLILSVYIFLTNFLAAIAYRLRGGV